MLEFTNQDLEEENVQIYSVNFKLYFFTETLDLLSRTSFF